jgi:NAD(P)-dependent dehydrogenase (short-subunit alcohol dehydrogenase family)
MIPYSASQRFDGRVAIVTGSTQGLGAEVARLLAAHGARGMIITGRSVERGAVLARELRDMGCNAVVVTADLEDARTPGRLVAAAADHFGVVHHLVNAAAITDRGTLLDTTVQLWDRMMAVNARAPMLLAQAGVDLMRRQGVAGSIVNVGSVTGKGGPPRLMAYAASKAALEALTRNLAAALRPDRIRVNQVNPGWMDTPGEHATQRSDGADGRWLERAAATAPFGRLVDPREVATAVVYLLSDASGVATGAVLDFDQHVAGTER